ncbi:siderophore-interacting protein [Humibacter ginsenosidimutans]|uniref:siderophore-interacting protein n=1 Tax=Humibacter ginsenosidimutans TaxID=2599293 RepID=UPI00143CD3A9|nr:SIP domain-containing protein [Humibacter ginsenosidimutans]
MRVISLEASRVARRREGAVTGTIVDVSSITSTIVRVSVALPAASGSRSARPHHATVDVPTPNGTVSRLMTPGPFRAGRKPGTTVTDFDVVTHGGAGALTPWARSARRGDELRLSFSPSRLSLPSGYGRYLLFADATALPALRVLLGDAGGLRCTAYAGAFYSDTPDYLKHHDSVEWLPANRRDDELAVALASLGRLQPDAFVWAAGAAHRMRPLRVLLAEQSDRPATASLITDHWDRDAHPLSAVSAS